MVGRETEFVPEYPLFYTHKGRKKLYELLGVETHKQFMEHVNSMQKGKGIPEDIYTKMLWAGLIWRHPELTLEDVDDIMERYSIMGYGLEDLDDKIVDAFVDSGLYNGKLVETFRELRDQQLSPETLEAMMKIRVDELVAKQNTGADKGEVKMPLTSTRHSKN